MRHSGASAAHENARCDCGSYPAQSNRASLPNMAEKAGLSRLEIALAEVDRIEARIAEQERRNDAQELERLTDLLVDRARGQAGRRAEDPGALGSGTTQA